MKTQKVKIQDLIPDNHNYNVGTEFGDSLISKSVEQFGAGRSILLDKNNRIISGNKTTEKWGASGNEDVLIIESDGKTLIAVKRNDIDLNTPQGREMALADNATAKANIKWDFDEINAQFDTQESKDWGVVEWENIEVEREIDLDEFSKTANSYENNTIRQIVLYYDIEQHKTTLEKLEKIGNDFNIDEDNSAVVLRLIEFYNKK